MTKESIASSGATPALSVVIPAYNEEPRLGSTLAQIIEYCDRVWPGTEIIVVDDGSTDRTTEVARRHAAGRADLMRVISLGENRGKGAAVRTGMLAARGAQVLFTDADSATPIQELSKLSAKLEQGFDIAIASRAISGADIRVRQHPLRELVGRGFNVFVRAVALDGVRDTQCGFKLFTRTAAQDLFGRSQVDGFAFDVEVLMLARGRYRIAEVPVVWRHVEESKVSRWAGAKSFLDIVALRLKR